MWTTVAFGLIWALSLFVPAQTNGNGTSIALKLTEFKKDLHHLLEGSRIRRKRELDEFSESYDYKLNFESSTLESLPYLANYSLTFWIPARHDGVNQILVGTTQGSLLLFEPRVETNGMDAKFIAQSEIVDIGLKAKAFSHYEEQWFCVLHESKRGSYIQTYHRIGRGLVRRQTLLGYSDLELVTMKHVHYMVVSNYNETVIKGTSYRASVELYYWAQTQFHKIEEVGSFGVRTLACWIIGGNLYLAIGQEQDDKGNFEIGSPIYFYNRKENRFVLWEKLPTSGPRKMQHFFIAGNHYIIVIGMKDAVIYWWSSGQFLEWQTLLGTAYASDLSVLPMNAEEVAIVIALHEEAVFYTLDNSGYYVESGMRMSFGGTLTSFQFIFSGGAYHALALLKKPIRQSIWKLTVGHSYYPTSESLDYLQQCLLDTKKLLEEREEELHTIEKDLERVWLKDSNQTISAKVIVTGKVTSNKQINTKNVLILKYTKMPDSSIENLEDLLIDSYNSMQDVKNKMSTAIDKSGVQEIEGTMYFNAPVFVPSLRLGSTRGDININGVSVFKIANSALRKTGNQTFLKKVLSSNIYVDNAGVSTLNGISPDDLLLRHGRQVVTGELTFSNIEASSLFVDSLNSIPVDNMVTVTSNQEIQDLKEFSKLTCDVCNVQKEVNWVDFKEMSKVATVDNYKEFKGSVIFQEPITVYGDLFVSGKINNAVNISRLMSQSVRKNTKQDLTGIYKFEQGAAVAGDLMVAGTINEVHMDNLLNLGSYQKIYADMHFSTQLEVLKDMSVGTVNDIDLNEEVVKKYEQSQFVSGRKIFTEDIFTDFVDMTEFVTLDGTDPSRLVQDIIQHQQGVVRSNSTTFKDVVVRGNITALQGINGYDIIDLPSSVWLKSVEQNITVPLEANSLYFENDLNADSVNNLAIQYDVVHSYSDEVIKSPKFFIDETNTISLDLSPQATINGINPGSLIISNHDKNKKTVYGTKEIDFLDIAGDVAIETLNDVPISDILQPFAPQTIYGPVEFPPRAIIQGDTKMDEISLKSFNGKDIKDYYENAVTLHDIARPVTDKVFGDLYASNLFIPKESKINEVSFHDLLDRAVTLDGSQTITASKSFGTTHFSKLISVRTLNDMDLYNFIGNIVLTDEVSQITNKKFESDTFATDVFVHGTVNGINLEEMEKNVFYKSEDNEVVHPFTFKNNVTINNLFTSSTLDGVKWENLIFLGQDEKLDSAWFLTNLHAQEDVFVTGHVNGYDLSELAYKAIYKNKSSQVIQEHLNVQNIIVEGNIITKDTVNNISSDQIKNFITVSGDQEISSDIILKSPLTIDNLYFHDLVNSVDVSRILEDAVRHSIAQDIEGRKEFKELHATVMSAGDVYASKVNGIILEELDRETVWKNGRKEIYGDKVFSQLNAHVATVNGLLNGLRLPQDVVLTDTSDHITHQTIFMSDVYIPTHLEVQGLIDGVDINKLIQQRVTRYSDQIVESHLTFKEDVSLYDELTIDGTVNEVVLELVAKVNNSLPIEGHKIFSELTILGPASASSINGYDLKALSSNIARYNEDDYIANFQVFEKPIHVQNSLIVEWVNGVPLKHLTDTHTLTLERTQATVKFFESLESNLQQQLSRQLSATLDQVSRFAYFTLFQEIDMGPTTKILYAYNLEDVNSNFSHSMVMWTMQKHCVYLEKCCHLEFSYWLRVKKNGVVVIENGPESGKYYPIGEHKSSVTHNTFFVWTNSTSAQPKWCNNFGKMFLASYNYQGIMEMFSDVEYAPLLSEIKTFRKGNLYSVAGFYYDTQHDEYSSAVVYGFDELNRIWLEHQILPSFGILSLDVISYNHGHREEILLAVGTGMKSLPFPYSTIYRWNNKDHAFESLQNIKSRYVPSVLWIRKGKDLLLALANVESWPLRNVDCDYVSGGEINIYAYSKEHFNWIQSILLGGVISLASFSVRDDLFIVAASSQHQTIYIYEWKGYESFVEIQTINIGEVKHISIYTIVDDTYMTVALASGPSKILKLVKRGNFSQPWNLDLKALKDSPDDKVSIRGC